MIDKYSIPIIPKTTSESLLTMYTKPVLSIHQWESWSENIFYLEVKEMVEKRNLCTVKS